VPSKIILLSFVVCIIRIVFKYILNCISWQLMMMELEKQRVARRSADIQKALNDIMWKGSTDLLKETGNKSTLYIKPYDAESFKRADNPGETKYEWIVDDRSIDISERPKTVPILPANLRLFKTDSYDSSIKSMTSTGSALQMLKKSQTLRSTRHLRTPLPRSSQNSVTSELSATTRLLSSYQNGPMSPIRSRTGTVTFDKPVQDSSFKGYTPSGGKRTLGLASTARLAQLSDSQSVTSLGSGKFNLSMF
jgi:hypothetical protein